MDPKILDLWDTPEASVHPRSQLYSLQPYGQGTALQEAMTSYLVRLANAHSVTPLMLITREVLPLTKIQLNKASGNFTAKRARTINSYTKYAREFSIAVGRLTGRDDLAQSSFTPWIDVFDPKGTGIVHERPRWCSHCLHDWRQNGQEGYFPLLWFAHSVKVCPTHNRVLDEVCPECGKHQLFIPKHYHIDHCTYCGTWLGHRKPHELDASDHVMTELDSFSAIAIAEMIQEGSRASGYASNLRFRNQLSAYTKILADGVMADFERMVGLRNGVLKVWTGGGVRPEIKQVLSLCFRVSTTPVKILRDDVPDDASRFVRKLSMHSARSKVILTIKDLKKLRDEIRALVETKEEPLSLKGVCEKFGYTYGFLRYRFPLECAAISENRKRYIRERAIENERRGKEIAYQIVMDELSKGRRYNTAVIEKLLRAQKQSLINPDTRAEVMRAKADFYKTHAPSEPGKS